MSREMDNVLRRLAAMEVKVDRITQIETKPRLILPGTGKRIFFEVDSAAIAGTSSPYNGKMLLTVTIKVTESNPSSIDTSVVVTDWATCLANEETTAAVVGREGWAFWGIAKSLASGAPAGTLTPYHWALDGFCCP